jgi:hypothetical protein
MLPRLRGTGIAVADYEYELRRGDEVVATGRIQLEERPAPGDMLKLGSKQVRVEDVLGRRLILAQ